MDSLHFTVFVRNVLETLNIRIVMLVHLIAVQVQEDVLNIHDPNLDLTSERRKFGNFNF